MSLIIALLPRIAVHLRSVLPSFLQPKFKDDFEEKGKEITNFITGTALDSESLQLPLDKADSRISESQIQEFKKIMYSVSAEYIDTESAYDLVINVVHLIQKSLEKLGSVNELEELMLSGRRDWRANKDWIGKSWRKSSEVVLLQIEELTDDKVRAISLVVKQALGVVDKEIEELRKKTTIKLVFDDSNFSEARGVKAGEFDALLSIDDATNTATLVFSQHSSMITKRTAQRQASSICKSGFELKSGRRVGIGCVLKVDEEM